MEQYLDEKLDEYYGIIVGKYERGIISEAKFDRLLGKLTEWSKMAYLLGRQ